MLGFALLSQLLVSATVAGQLPAPAPENATEEPGSNLRVWLVTAGPGEAVWERYGHNAIRVLDTTTGRDVSYNWGVFDFQQVDFIPRFLQGRMLYEMAVFPTGPMIQSYARAGRSVVMQELALSSSQRAALVDLAERNALPENRDYIYQYFVDNCSTRVRDLLDVVLDGALSAMFGSESTGVSYRFHTRRLSKADPMVSVGMDLLLGTPTDSELTVWEEMFLPLKLRDAVRRASVAGPGGQRVPLVVEEEELIEARRPTTTDAAPSWFFALLAIGLIMGGVLALAGTSFVHERRAARIAIAATAVLWSFVAGVAGTILILLLFTDHEFAWWNENLFLFGPLSLVLAGLIPLAGGRGRAHRVARGVAVLILGAAVLGLLVQVHPDVRQGNAHFFALALPAHIGLAMALIRGAPDPK